jgi:hypothetical protein
MESKDINTDKRSLSRRDFTKKSILAIASVTTAGAVGYSILTSKRFTSFNNYMRIGHCAPSVMQTLLDINGIQNNNMVLYAGAMAGGIAGSSMECGGLTVPLMFISYQKINYSITEELDLLNKAQSYVNEFASYNGSSICEKIRKGGMSACRKAACQFNKPFSKAISNSTGLSDEAKESYLMLRKAFNDNKFHCAHSVLNNLNCNFIITKELIDASWIFIGGIALLNRTCGALAAGVMAISSINAKIENSYIRVARMNRLLRQNSHEAMNDEINHFNRAIKLGEELGSWFRREFRSTTCYDICGYNFSKIKDSQNYISANCINRCAEITQKVSQKVIQMT